MAGHRVGSATVANHDAYLYNPEIRFKLQAAWGG
jgi:hypothetical protein